MTISFIRGGLHDLPAIMPVMTGAFGTEYGEAWTERQCEGVLSMGGSHLIVAKTDAAVGFALSRTVFDECELMLLAVRPQMQNQGVGRALLSEAMMDAQSAGARQMFLEVRQGNPAMALYLSAGFGEVGRRRGYYRAITGATYDALTFRRALS